MTKTTPLFAGSWAVALLVGIFAWLSPDSALFPGPIPGAIVVGGAFVLLLVGILVSSISQGAPRGPWTEYLTAIAPMVGAVIALVLATRGLLPHPALPLAFIVAFGVGQAWWTRGHSASPITRAGDIVIAALLVATLTVVVPALGLAVGGQKIWQLVTPNLTNVVPRIESTRSLDRYRPTPRTGISADAAGMALHAIAATGSDRRDSLTLAVPGTSARAWIPDTGGFAGWSGDSVMAYAMRGLTAAERAWLARVAAHPSLGLVDSVAFAERVDLWAALRLPLPATMTGPALPIPRFLPIRAAARARLFAATLAATSNRHAEADSLIRTVIGFGLRLRDDSDLLIGTLIGSSIAREAGRALAAHWRVQGRILMADSLVSGLALLAQPLPDSAADRRPGRSFRAGILASASSAGSGRAMRWENLSMLGLAPCTNLNETLYGPSAAVREAFAAAAPAYRGTPGGKAAFEALERGIAGGLTTFTIPVFLRPAAWALGPTGGNCATAVFGTMAMD